MSASNLRNRFSGSRRIAGNRSRMKGSHSRERPVYKFTPYKFMKIICSNEALTGAQAHKSGPKPRSGHRIVCNNGDLFSFGGYNPSIREDDPDMLDDPVWKESRPLFKELWWLNLATRRWSWLKTQGNMPEELASHTALLKGSTMLVYGGTGVPFGMNSSNSLRLCDFRTMCWLDVEAEGELPLAQYGQAVLVHNGYFYTIGGTTGYEYSLDVHRLDLKERKWEALYVGPTDESEPLARYRHEVAFDGTRIYILGGGTANHAYALDNIPVFSIETNKWESVATCPDNDVYPAPRRCHGCVQFGDDVFICGGYNGAVIFPDMWKLNLKSKQWLCLPQQMPQPVFFHATTITPAGCMHLFGGVTEIRQNTRTSDVYRIWLTVPKLKEICWEAMLHYSPAIDVAPKSKLLEIGIPGEFVDRIKFRAACG